MAVDDAIASGARALFGEKYGDEVRVVSMGLPVAAPGTEAGQGRIKNFSVELCGGTHAERTGDIGAITIVAESAVGAGVRRIEALTADAARRHRAEEARTLASLAGILKAPVSETPDRLTALMEDRRRLERELAETRRKLAMGASEDGSGRGSRQTEIGGVAFRRSVVEGLDMRDLKPIVDEEKKRLGSGIVAIVGKAPDGKAGLVVGVTDDLTERYDAVGLVRAGAGALGGKGGGGRRDMAQAGGPNGDGAEAALDAIEQALTEAA
jgi:alanyl-tRNA synthetase